MLLSRIEQKKGVCRNTPNVLGQNLLTKSERMLFRVEQKATTLPVKAKTFLCAQDFHLTVEASEREEGRKIICNQQRDKNVDDLL